MPLRYTATLPLEENLVFLLFRIRYVRFLPTRKLVSIRAQPVLVYTVLLSHDVFFFFNQVPETRAMSLCNLQIPKKTWRNDSESSWQRFSNLEQGFKVMTVYPVR